MSGILAATFASGVGGTTTTVTTGHETFAAKGFFVTYTGYGTAAISPTGIAFGSLTTGTWNGFTIIGIYNNTSDSGNAGTFFVVSGDASAYSPSMTVDGVNQGIGAGSFAGGNTTFSPSSIVANPFGADSSTHDVVIIG